MSNLISNEIIKIFKKKAIWILALITVGIIIAVSVITKNQKNRSYSHYTYDLSYIEYIDNTLKGLDPKNASDNAQYIELISDKEMYELARKYKDTNWKQDVIYNYMFKTINEVNQYKYSLEKDEEGLKKAEQKYNEELKQLESDDWKYFAKIQLKNVESQIKSIEMNDNDEEQNNKKDNSNQLEVLKVEKQALQWRIDKDIEYGNGYYSQAIENYKSYMTQAINSKENVGNKKEQYDSKKEYENELKKANLYKYDIENNTKTQEEDSAHGMLLKVYENYEIFIIAAIIMIAGTIVSEEFNKGTIKLLLVKPYKRTTILAAKFITCILVMIIVMAFIIGVQAIVGGVTFGWESMKEAVVNFNTTTHEIVKTNMLVGLLTLSVAKLPIYILLMTLSFTLSTLFINSPLAISLPLLGYMGSPLINEVAQVYKLEWIKYFVTPNWDLNQYLYGGLPDFYGLTIGFSLSVCILYLVIMLGASFATFKKRNIKNI